MTEENRELETVSGGTAPEETAADTPMPAQSEAAAEAAEAPDSAAEPDGLEPADLGSDTIAAEPPTASWALATKLMVTELVIDRKSTRLNSSHSRASRMPSSA